MTTAVLPTRHPISLFVDEVESGRFERAYNEIAATSATSSAMKTLEALISRFDARYGRSSELPAPVRGVWS